MSRSPVRVEQEDRTMSASTTQPITGHANQSAPLGALAILVGALALGAVGIALGQGYKAAPAAVVPADVQAALYAQRMGEKEPLFVVKAAPADVQAALYAQRMGEKEPLFVVKAAPADIQAALHAHRMGEKAPLFSAPGFPSAISGPSTGTQKGLGGSTDRSRQISPAPGAYFPR
jgi:hypothetical protein